jgi:hypothetical protein
MMARVLLVVFSTFSLLIGAASELAVQTGTVRFAVIGDYGSGSRHAAAVAEMVRSWHPDFIITTGDNNYPTGAASTIDRSIGQFYHDFIHPYVGSYGEGAATNRFFPVLGNHDVDTALGQPYLDYFVLPGNERYYDFVAGPVHFFALNSDWREPDGIHSASAQAMWLQSGLAASASPWKLVYMHVPPYSSGLHGSGLALRWPYQAWGATAVLSGHNHQYERVVVDGFPYFVNGAGGAGLYGFSTIVEGSQVRYNASYGAMLVTASAERITFEFYSIAGGGALIDTYTITQS